MAADGTTGVVVEIDLYDRSDNTVGALTVIPAKDIETVDFSLPENKTVRVDGLAEVFEYMIANGKKKMPDCSINIRTDVNPAGGVADGSASKILSYPEEHRAPTRTLKITLATGLSVAWEVLTRSMKPELPKDGVIMSTHVLYHAGSAAPAITGF